VEAAREQHSRLALVELLRRVRVQQWTEPGLEQPLAPQCSVMWPELAQPQPARGEDFRWLPADPVSCNHRQAADLPGRMEGATEKNG
jgi:hypothetical protein